jgi:DUF438 domain-containing protein
MSEFLNNSRSPFEGKYPDGHPVRTYLEENLLIRSLINEIESLNIQEQFAYFKELFDKLAKVELHFAR